MKRSVDSRGLFQASGQLVKVCPNCSAERRPMIHPVGASIALGTSALRPNVRPDDGGGEAAPGQQFPSWGGRDLPGMAREWT